MRERSVMMGRKQGDSGQRGKPAGLITYVICCILKNKNKILLVGQQCLRGGPREEAMFM